MVLGKEGDLGPSWLVGFSPTWGVQVKGKMQAVPVTSAQNRLPDALKQQVPIIPAPTSTAPSSLGGFTRSLPVR